MDAKPERITQEFVIALFNRLQSSLHLTCQHLASLEGEMARFAEAWREWRDTDPARKKGGDS